MDTCVQMPTRLQFYISAKLLTTGIVEHKTCPHVFKNTLYIPVQEINQSQNFNTVKY